MSKMLHLPTWADPDRKAVGAHASLSGSLRPMISRQPVGRSYYAARHRLAWALGRLLWRDGDAVYVMSWKERESRHRPDRLAVRPSAGSAVPVGHSTAPIRVDHIR